MTTWKMLFALAVLPALFAPLRAQSPFRWTTDSTDAYFGTDDYLVTGRPYSPTHHGATGHPFLSNNEWLVGEIYLKGHAYPGEVMKFDLESQRLLLRHKTNGDVLVALVLSEQLIDSFKVANTFWIRQLHTQRSNDTLGYAEVLHRGQFEVYRKQTVDFLATYNALSPKGSYSKAIPRYALLIDNQWMDFSRFTSLLKALPDKGKQIRTVARQNHIRLRKATSQQISLLLNTYDDNR